MSSPTELEERFHAVRRRIEEACRRAGRRPEDVSLIGASKGQPVEVLAAAHRAGLRHFGENRVQEALFKGSRLPADIEWHLFGPLQSNKAKVALELFRTIHSIDRLKIARLLDRRAAEQGLRPSGFLEVNLAREQSKHGFDAEELLRCLPDLAGLTHLRIVGLMAIPPMTRRPEDARPWFAQLRRVRDRIAPRAPWPDFPGHLSMGMSDDFEVAIEEQATHVRIGTALFGPRPSEAGI